MNRRSFALLAIVPLAATVLIAAPSGAVVPTCHGLEATIVGTPGADHLTGTDGPDVVYLDSGNDTFAGKGGDDTICGGSGDDRIYPGAGNDFVFGDDGADHIFGGSGNDTYRSGANNGDLLSYDTSGVTNLRLDIRSHTATKANGTDSFSGFAKYTGTPGADTLIGGATNDYLNGDGGSDTIYGFGGKDHISVHDGTPVVDAGTGNDVVRVAHVNEGWIRLGDGQDTLNSSHIGSGNHWTGGTGVDTFTTYGFGMHINLNQGFVKVTNTNIRWHVAGFENVVGTFGDDRIVGSSSANRLVGNGNKDVLIGLGGNDVLLGNDNNYYADTADGGTGTDTCRAYIAFSCEHRITQRPNPYGAGN